MYAGGSLHLTGNYSPYCGRNHRFSGDSAQRHAGESFSGDAMLLIYCVVSGIANAMPIWLNALLGIALLGELIYMSWFSKDKLNQNPFRLAFWVVLAWFSFVAIMIARLLR